MRVETLLDHINCIGEAINEALEHLEAEDIASAISILEQASDFTNATALRFCMPGEAEKQADLQDE